MFVTQRKRVYVDERGIPEKVDILTSYRRPGAQPSQIAPQEASSSSSSKLGCFLFLLLILLGIAFVYYLAFTTTENKQERVFFERSILKSYLQQLKGQRKELGLEQFSRELNETEREIFSREIMKKMKCQSQNEKVFCTIAPS